MGNLTLTKRMLVCGDGVNGYLVVAADGHGDVYATEQFYGAAVIYGFLWDITTGR